MKGGGRGAYLGQQTSTRALGGRPDLHAGPRQKAGNSHVGNMLALRYVCYVTAFIVMLFVNELSFICVMLLCLLLLFVIALYVLCVIVIVSCFCIYCVCFKFLYLICRQ